MKTILKHKLVYFSAIGLFTILTISCGNKNTEHTAEIAINLESNTTSTDELKTPFKQSQNFKDYWFAGEAEITSYKLEQARYGEMREGHAVMVFVTEPFLKKEQVKANKDNPSNIPVLKLNATKRFNTGVYPYSIMQSTFYPISNNQHAVKVSCSVQEWCGQVYTQLNNQEQFDITSHSYFEGEADQDFSLEKGVLENELWTQLRIDPKSLPTGEFKIIPSLEYTRLKHKQIKSYNASAELQEGSYTLTYSDLDRILKIDFNPNFPFDIIGWEDTYKSGFGKNAEEMTTKATKLKSIKSAYWSKNSNKDEVLRETLQLN